FNHIAARSDLEETAGELFDVVEQGVVSIQINQRYKLSDAATAHRDLEERRTTGTSVMLPE
ncbi:MAG: zinc-binding dehydrogenase, partial [Pannonibacter indicus]